MVTDVNLEHILPINPGADWVVDSDAAEAAHRLLGNMLLMKSRLNSEMGNSSFEAKKASYAKSGYSLTKEVAVTEGDWTVDKIRLRQRDMAAWAIKTWPLTLPT